MKGSRQVNQPVNCPPTGSQETSQAWDTAEPSVEHKCCRPVECAHHLGTAQLEDYCVLTSCHTQNRESVPGHLTINLMPRTAVGILKAALCCSVLSARGCRAPALHITLALQVVPTHPWPQRARGTRTSKECKRLVRYSSSSSGSSRSSSNSCQTSMFTHASLCPTHRQAMKMLLRIVMHTPHLRWAVAQQQKY
jgi:hypothetical protein